MAPPSYSALGSEVRDIFRKGYFLGFWNMNCKTKTTSGIEFNTNGYSNADEANKVFGSVGTKYTFADYGLTLSDKWTTEKVLMTELSVQDKILEGLNLGLGFNLLCETWDKEFKLKAGYGHEHVRLDADFNIDENSPVVNFAAVLGYENFLGGYQTAFDTAESTLTTNNFALGYSTKDLVLLAHINNGEDFSGSIFSKCTDTLDVGLQLAQASAGEEGEGGTEIGIGCRYQLNEDAFIRAKVNNNVQIGLSYQQKLHDGITGFLFTLIEGSDFNAGGHKIGVSVEIEV